MNIGEATQKAIEEKGVIYRRSCFKAVDGSYAVIKPTNSYECCQIINYVRYLGQDKRVEIRHRNWNPTADDLMADDWEVRCESGDVNGKEKQ